MKSKKDGIGYNERLFGKGLRGFFHKARFRWLHDTLDRYNIRPASVLEIGCFDGKAIHYLPEKPQNYTGIDANWEGGLDIAQKNFQSYDFFAIENPQQLPEDLPLSEFQLVLAMETHEHVPPELLDYYLDYLHAHCSGYFLVTVPNEKGPLFLAKWIIKRLFSKDAREYTFSELINATLGRMDKVRRDEHKGFDYDSMIESVKNKFEIICIQGHPFRFLPKFLCFGIGILAKAKH